MPALDGVGVLITRPAHQAAALCRLFEAEGAAVIRFAALDIQPLAEPRSRAAPLGPIGDFDLIIFASANAVRFGAALLEVERGQPLAAIGPATARALHNAGYQTAVQAQAGFDSESLLSHPALSPIAGRRILLVKGQGGRELLQQELQRRGATVTLAEVYRRERRAPAAEELRALESRFERREIQVITATSGEIGVHLIALATPALRRCFEAAHWLVPGARVENMLRQKGLQAPMVRAASAEDQDLVSAVVRWRSAVSGA